MSRRRPPMARRRFDWREHRTSTSCRPPAPAMLWRVDEARHGAGALGPVAAVQLRCRALRLFKANGMVEIKVTDSANGYIEAGRLTPGDAAAAARAWCTYNAGPTPENGEVLSHTAMGHATAVDRQSVRPTGRGQDPLRRRCRPGQRVPRSGRRDDDGRAAGRAGRSWSSPPARYGAAPAMVSPPACGRSDCPDWLRSAATCAGDPARSQVKAVDLSDQAFEQE